MVHVPEAPAQDRILVVEDEGIVALELRERLTTLGYHVIGPTSTGEDAVRLALTEHPDLVLMDVRLKGKMDGPEAAEQIRQHWDAPFVFLTAHADEATLARVNPIEPHAYVIKPFEERSLGVTIRMVLHRDRAVKARAAAERAQRRVEARHQAVLDHSHDGIVSVDREQRIIVFNKGAERIFGFAAEEIVGQPLDALLPRGLASSHREEFQRFRMTGSTSRPMGGTREVFGRRRTGEVFPAEVTISRIDIDGEEVLTACIRDVSERRLLEEQFAHAQKMEVVGRLAASVAHDFNNLLTAVQSNVYLLKCEGHPHLQEHIDEIAATVDRGTALTRQLLGFSRHQPTVLQTYEANELVTKVQSLLGRLLGTDITLRTELDPSAGRVHVDRNLIEQVLMNLAVNARDAMPEGGKLSIRTGTERVANGSTGSGHPLASGLYVRIEVADTGEGVPDGLGEKVFEPFFTTKTPDHGTGLGLSTVRAIARRSGGEVYLRNEGPGSTFVVLLPQVNGQPRSTRPRVRDDSAPTGTETVLVVDDDPSILRAISQILRRSGYLVRAAGTCEAALAHVAPGARPLDLLLSELVLPGCSGTQFAQRMLALRPGLSVLFMTGHVGEAVPQRPDGSGPETVLAKPVPPLTLLSVIRECLDARAAARDAKLSSGVSP